MELPAGVDRAILDALADAPRPVRAVWVVARLLDITEDEARLVPELSRVASRLVALRERGAVVRDYDRRSRCVYSLPAP